MRLLLDEMFPPATARQLRDQFDHDALAVAEDTALCGSTDDEIFGFAQSSRRATVTENVPDFRRLGQAWAASGRAHHGLVFTTNRRYPRHRPETVGRLVVALAALVATEGRSAPPSNREIWL